MRSGRLFAIDRLAGTATRPRGDPSTYTVSVVAVRTHMRLCQRASATPMSLLATYARVEPAPTTTHCARCFWPPICSFHWLSVVATPFCTTFDDRPTWCGVAMVLAPHRNERVPGSRSGSSVPSSSRRAHAVLVGLHFAGKRTYRSAALDGIAARVIRAPFVARTRSGVP